jgi:hypothetical protein
VKTLRLWLVLLLACAVHGAAQQVAAPAFPWHRYEAESARLFDRGYLTDPSGEFAGTCANLLLMMQGVSAAIIVAAMIGRLRRDNIQMEGIASVMIQVAFIALIGPLSTTMCETADAAANAIGYHASTHATIAGSAAPAPATPPGVTTALWDVAGTWIPGETTPYLDALESQDVVPPASGTEEAWANRAWNWARGVGTTTAAMFDQIWQACSGSLRGLTLQLGCAAIGCLALLSIFATYAGELLRDFLFWAGAAFLPLFVAGLSVEALKNQSIRFILRLTSIACWPIGWALVGSVTKVLLDRTTAWMTAVVSHALGVSSGSAPPPVAIAAPYLSWGILFLFGAVTVVICVWWIAGVLLAPVAISRALSSGAMLVEGFVGATIITDAVRKSGALTSNVGGLGRTPEASVMRTAQKPRLAEISASGGSLRRSVGIEMTSTQTRNVRPSPLAGTHLTPPASQMGGLSGSARACGWLKTPARRSGLSVGRN